MAASQRPAAPRTRPRATPAASGKNSADIEDTPVFADAEVIQVEHRNYFVHSDKIMYLSICQVLLVPVASHQPMLYGVSPAT